MSPRTRTYVGLGVFVAIQAVSVVALGICWPVVLPESPAETRVFALLGAHLVMIAIAAGAAALIFRAGNGPAGNRPPTEPPSLSPAGLPLGPRRPGPLVAHARAA